MCYFFTSVPNPSGPILPPWHRLSAHTMSVGRLSSHATLILSPPTIVCPKCLPNKGLLFSLLLDRAFPSILTWLMHSLGETGCVASFLRKVFPAGQPTLIEWVCFSQNWTGSYHWKLSSQGNVHLSEVSWRRSKASPSGRV